MSETRTYYLVRIKSNLGHVGYAITTRDDGKVVQAQYATEISALRAVETIRVMNPKATITVVPRTSQI